MHYFVKNSFSLEPHFICSEASHMFVKIKQKCADIPKATLQQINVQTKNNLKSKDFKQLPM